MRPDPASAARSKPGAMVTLPILESFRRDQHQAIAEEVFACVVFDEIVFDPVVHPVDVGRQKDVGGRALFDLLHQRRACRVAGDDFNPALLGEQTIDLVKRIFQRSGREDGDRFLLRHGCCDKPPPLWPRKSGQEMSSLKHDSPPKAWLFVVRREKTANRSTRSPWGTIVPGGCGKRSASRISLCSD